MTKHPDRPESGRRLRPSNDASRISEALALASSDRPEPDLLGVLEVVIHLRSLRTRYLPPRLLGEPVWDILLELLHAELVNQTVTRVRLSVAARLPLEVANRWVEALVQSGLCSSESDTDARHVKLSPEGDAALREYFAQLPQALGHRS